MLQFLLRIAKLTFIYCLLTQCLSINADEIKATQPSFVIVISAHNTKDWYEQNLDSVLTQTYPNYRVIYIADGSTDKSEELVENYIKENEKEDLVTLIKNQERRGHLACTCQAVFSCREDEIVVELDGTDWLANEEVLSKLSELYTDPNVWMTYGQFTYYPDFWEGFASPIPKETIEKNDFRSLHGCVSHLRTFYAGLFQQIKKEDFLDGEKFFPRADDLAYIIPMLEMAGTHSRFVPEVLYVLNYSAGANSEKSPCDLEAVMDKKIRSKEKYSPLPELPFFRSKNKIPPGSFYGQIGDICHPSFNDYRILQNYLMNGTRENLDRLGNMVYGIRQMKLIGNPPNELPHSGSINVNCPKDSRENCILIYSTFNRNFPNALKRLLKLIVESDYKGHVLYRLGGWPNEAGGSLVLSHVPYGFKCSFFKEAERMGFKRVLWLDSAVVPVASLNDIFAMIEDKGYFVMGNSHMIGPYMNPITAVYFGLTMEQTQQIPSCSAGLFGVDLTQKVGKNLLNDWYHAAHDKDAFFSLRSDQNALSMLLSQYGLTDLTPLDRMPHAEMGDEIKPDSLFYLDRLFTY